MRAHQALRHRRQNLFFAKQQLAKPQLAARPSDVVQRDKIGDLALLMSDSAS
jgi:hypothetical protein